MLSWVLLRLLNTSETVPFEKWINLYGHRYHFLRGIQLSGFAHPPFIPV
jgi:hypothetical protein